MYICWCHTVIKFHLYIYIYYNISVKFNDSMTPTNITIYIYIYIYILQPKHRYSLLSQKKWDIFVENPIFYYVKVIPGKVIFKTALWH